MKYITLKQKAAELINSLPPAKVKQAVDYLECLKGDYDAFDVHEKVKAGLHDVKRMREGKVKAKTLKVFLRER